MKDLRFDIVASDRTAAAFASLQRNLRMVDGMAAGVSDRLSRVGAALRRFGQGAALAALPAGAALRSLLAPAADFEKSLNRLAAVSGAAGADFARLRDLAKDLGASTAFSAGQAAEGMTFLAMAGFDAAEILAATPGVLQLAAAAQMDLADAADIASNVLTGFGLAAGEVARVNDVMVATMTGANTDLRQLGDAFKYVGPVASAVGLSLEETAAIIGRMSDAGIQGEMAGTALRGALTRLLNPTAEVSRGLEAIGVSVTDASGQLLPFSGILRRLAPHADNAAAMMQIFGQRAGPAMVALLRQGAENVEAFTATLEAAGGTAERVAEQQMRGLSGSLAALRSAWEGLGIAIADSGVLDMLTGLVRGATDLVRGLSEASPALLKFSAVLAGVTVAAGALGLALGGVSLALGAITGPVGLVVFGLAGAAGLVTALSSARVEADGLTSATDNITLALGDEIRQSQALSQVLGTSTTMSVDAAQKKLAEAKSRYENVKAIIAEKRAHALQSNEWASLTRQIGEAQAALNALGFPAIDAAPRHKADAFEAAQRHLADLLVKRQKLLEAGQAETEQLRRTEENIAKLTDALANAQNGVVRFGGSAVEIIEPAARVSRTVTDVATAARGGAAGLDALAGTAEDAAGKALTVADMLAGVGRGLTDGLKEALKAGRLSFQTFGDFILSWGERVLDSILSRVLDPIGDALQKTLDGLATARSVGGAVSGGGLFGGLVNATTGLFSGLFSGLPGFDTGGVLTVGGRAGVDRNIAAFRVSAGERVRIERQGAAPAPAVNVYIQTPDPAAFRASRGQIAAEISRAVAAGQRFT